MSNSDPADTASNHANDDPIQRSLESERVYIVEKYNPKLCLLHFYSAPSDHKAGAIRRTSVFARSKTTLQKEKKSTGIDHETALNRYIRRLKRQNTFLSLIAQIFSIRTDCKELTFEIEIDNNSGTAPIKVTRQRNSQSQSSSLTYTIRLSREYKDCLLEEKIANQTIKHLYAKREDYRKLETNGVLDQDITDADICVANALRICHSDLLPKRKDDALRSALTQQSSQKEDKPTRTQREQREQRELWRFLHILQSALLYARGGSRSHNDISNQGMVLCARRLENAPPESTSIGVLILVPEKKASGCKPDDSFLELHLKAQDLAKSEEWRLPDVGEARGLNSNFWEKLKGEIARKLFPFTQFYSRAALFTQWTLILLDRLRESVHEGEALEFWFVIGEKSEFDDHAAIDIIDIDTAGDDALNTAEVGPQFSQIPSVQYKQGSLERATRQLEKEHFPWFALGRHALFWNVSGAGTQPLALVKLRGGNWSQTVTEANREQQRLEIPPCVVVYQGQKGNRGVLLVTPRTDAANRVALEHLVAWRGQRWQLANSDDGNFEKVVEDALHFQSPENGDSYIAKLCCRLARDPDRGGCIVFVKQEDTAKKFVRMDMGRSWRLSKDGSLDSDDVLALMSHDGATIVWRGKSADDAVPLRASGSGSAYQAVFRCLLPHEAGKYAELGQSVHDSEDFPLASAGSRRWSSAVTAFTPDVQAVLVVSQDGDLQVWRGGPTRDRLKGAKVVMISAGSGRKTEFKCEREKEKRGGKYYYRWVPV